MKIKVYNNFGNIDFDYKKVIKDVKKYFFEKTEVSLILVDINEIRRINLEYRKNDSPTDVISFESGEESYLGDIFICIDKIGEQASNYGHSLNREFAFLLVHGILHLKGYDHLAKEEEIIMFQKQDEILNEINYLREK
jgi:probable rRNA maturation factor